jgi:hypothetical protein
VFAVASVVRRSELLDAPITNTASRIGSVMNGTRKALLRLRQATGLRRSATTPSPTPPSRLRVPHGVRMGPKVTMAAVALRLTSVRAPSNKVLGL